MKTFTYLLLCLFLGVLGGNAQTTPHASPVEPGVMLVKLKPQYRSLLETKPGKRQAPLQIGELSVQARPLSMPSADAKAKRLRGTSGIDVGLYHQLRFDPMLPVEEAIEKALASGMLELAEPAYLHTVNYTPNDPNIGVQYYLDLCRAFEAWDLQRNNEGIVIAIVDSGIDLEHPDLAANIYRNEADPINGVDDDGDGFLDNYWGWDFVGADYQNPEEDNDPSIDTENASHGTYVAGAASAVTDNALGVAGMGFNAKLMALKHTADNDERSNGTGYILGGILGLIYAAEHGADIINASYGGNTFSQIEQDLIRYISEDLGALVVAASGNENSAEPHYPSDYDYVLSVAASNQLDNKAGFSNFGFKVDLSAPGTNIYTTDVADGYTTVNGTSFSAPIVSGAAALVKAQYPNFTGAQLGEVLRISADPAFLNNVAEEYKDKMGHGRLDAYAALTTQSPSVRLDQSVVEGPSGDIAKPGESIQLYGDFINFLWPVSNVQVSLSTSSEYLQIVEGTISIPSLGMLESVSSQATPFVLQLANNVPFNTEVTLRIDYTASGYQDYQLIQLVLNPSYYNLNANLVATSIIDDGRIGYQDIDAKRGQGFVFSDVNMLFEMGIIAGSSSTKLVSNVRSAAGAYDSDFRSNLDIEKTEPGETADVEIFGSFTDADAPATNRLNLRVDYHAYAWKEEPYTNFIIMQYTIKNISGSYLPGVHFGLYADWDISANGTSDKADWNDETQTAYVYTPNEENLWVAGIQVLTGKPNYWAIDNDQSISGNPFGVYDDYTDEEKWQSISSGIGREQAGQTGEGNDVSHAVAAGPYNIPADSSIVIAFALHGESTIEGLLSSAEAASQLYISTFGLPPNKAEVDEIAGLMVYPNPSSGLLYVKLAEAGREEVQLRLLDVIGRTLVSQRYAAAAEQIELEMPAEAGLYYLEVRHGDKRSIRKILRQ